MLCFRSLIVGKGETCLPELKKTLHAQRVAVGWLRSLALFAALQVLCILGAIADEPATPTQEAAPLPSIKSLGSIYYPDKAKRLNLEGSVLAEFSIDAKGKATGVKLIHADDPLFDDMAMKGFSAGRYDVPADWTAANSTVRYRVVMVFCLPPSNQITTFTESPYHPIIVAGSRIGHLPVQTVPGTCKAKQ
jgi:TonB family protein